MTLNMALNITPTNVSLTSEATVETLFSFSESSPLDVFEKNIGESRNVRAITAFCTCISAMFRILMM